MMHKIKLLLAILCFSVQTQTFSNDAKLSNTHGSPEEFSCNLVVTGLHTTNITSNSITVAWNPDPNFSVVEVTAYDSITNAVLVGPITAAAGSAYLGWLPSSTAVRIGAVPRCLNGELSTQTTNIFARTSDIVIEIVGKLQCGSSGGSWTSNTMFSGADIVSSINFSQSYICEIYKNINGEEITSQFNLSGTDQNGLVKNVTAGTGSLQGGNGTRVRFVENNGVALCTLALFSDNTNGGKFILQNVVNNNFYYFRIRPCIDGKPKPVQGRENIILQYDPVSISPNPFNDHLTIQFPENNDNDGPATAAIYHLNGMLAHSQTLDAASGKTLTMNTSGLPAGMYLLRTETLTGVTTKLVMKAE